MLVGTRCTPYSPAFRVRAESVPRAVRGSIPARHARPARGPAGSGWPAVAPAPPRLSWGVSVARPVVRRLVRIPIGPRGGRCVAERPTPDGDWLNGGWHPL